MTGSLTGGFRWNENQVGVWQKERRCLLASLPACSSPNSRCATMRCIAQASNPTAFGWDVEAVLHGEAAALLGAVREGGR